MPTPFVANTDGLRDDQARSRARAYAHVLRSLAGRVRFLAEMATGGSIFLDGTPSVPKNPQGLYGLDFSGPPFGSAWRHVIASCGGIKPSASWETTPVLGSVVAGANLVLPIRLWVRPHVLGERGPYSRGYPVLRVYQSSAVASFSVTARCRSLAGDDVPREQAFNVVTTTESTITLASTYWDLRPGFNDVELELETASSTAMVLASFSVNQIEKRGH